MWRKIEFCTIIPEEVFRFFISFIQSGVVKNSESNVIKKEYPVVVALQGPLDGRRWEIRDELIIGRGEDCQIQIDDRQVSRHHARLIQKNGKVVLEDLGSKNGTFLANKIIDHSVTLNDADTFQIAIIYKFVHYYSDATMPMEDFVSPLMNRNARLVVDEKSRRVWINDTELLPPLSAPQFRLLAELVSNAGRVVARNELICAIWEDEEAEGVSEQALDALIRRLRDRLLELDPDHQYIITVRGHGLRYSEND